MVEQIVVRVPPELMVALDKLGKRRGSSRSELVRTALWNEITRNNGGTISFQEAE